MAYPVPYSAPLPFALHDGREIVVDGVSGHGDGFSINLCDGPDLNSNTALHINPRFNQNEVVRTHNWGGWGAEEKHGGFPFQRGAPYQVKVVVRNHAYQIFVNNVHFCDFAHRVPKEGARYVFVTGDTRLTKVSFLHACLVNPPLPLTHHIPGGLHPGRMITVNGVPTGDAFSINLMSGGSFEASDLLMHLVVRMGQRVIARTHRAGAGGWGGEEAGPCPLQPGAPFEIMVLEEHHCFKVAINGQHFCEFAHRLPGRHADHVHVRGDAAVSMVRMM